MKKRITALLLVLVLALGLAGCGEKPAPVIQAGGSDLVLNVYNWGEYVSDGSEGSFDTIREFEAWFAQTYGQTVKVNYSTFPSNEDMYSKLSSGAVSYDVVVPSDYMIERLREEDMLAPLNFDNIPNYQYIDENFKNLYYDPDNLYSVPYTCGMVGVIYDANVVDEADVGDWDLLWNPKYKDKILQYNNSRDAFGVAMYKLGLDVNSTDHAVWDRAHDELVLQRPMLYGLVMDEVFNLMESGEAAIASYYAGDYLTMRDAQAHDVDLQFYYPERTNFYIDAMCIPRNAQHKELAEIFINYMLSEQPAVANALHTGYASPNVLVRESEEYQEEMGEEAIALLYPDLSHFAEKYNQYAYRNLDIETLHYINDLWEMVKIN